MEITNIRLKINNATKQGSILGVASVQFDNCLVIHDMKLIQLDKERRIVRFPNRKIKLYNIENGDLCENITYTDIIHPSNKEFRDYVETELFKFYDMEINNNGGEKYE